MRVHSEKGQRGNQDWLKVISPCKRGFLFQTSDPRTRGSLPPDPSIGALGWANSAQHMPVQVLRTSV